MSKKFIIQDWAVNVMDVDVRGPCGYHKRRLSSVAVSSIKNQFEHKVAALYFYREAVKNNRLNEGKFFSNSSWIATANYAKIFGSFFD